MMKENSESDSKKLTVSKATRVTFEMSTNIDDNRPVSVIGSFNNWGKDNNGVHLERVGHGLYRGSVLFPHQKKIRIEYNYTKGGTGNVETDRYGSTSKKRSITLAGNERKKKDIVVRWMWHGKNYRDEFLPKIEAISHEFNFPPMIRTRRVAALLPHDYHQTNKRYPVLYLQDGQNLFDDFAPFGNWSLDKKLALMAEFGCHEFIVIAIDHAKEQRIAEFTPTHQTKLGVGEGKNYARFLAHDLKPFVDAKYRTLPDRQHTGVGGSSMGALVSLYAGLTYPEVYSKMLIFSPSLWVDPNIIPNSAFSHDGSEFKLYLYTGGNEGAGLIQQANRFMHSIYEHTHKGWNIKAKTSYNPQGKHNEYFWGEEFPKAVEWLFFEHTKTD